jgi:hypothetical protein
MSGQAESRHFFRVHDSVEDPDGRGGVVVRGSALYATVRWRDGEEQELEQFDARVVVTLRGDRE